LDLSSGLYSIYLMIELRLLL
ncbi:hypothetical protein ANG4_2041, partial [Streptococcus anginosus 1505]